MKKILSLLALSCLGMGAWAQTSVELTTDVNNPHYYKIESYNRGGVLTSNGAGQAVTHVAMSNSGYWFFTAADDNTEGSVIFHNLDGTQLKSDWTTSATGDVLYILENGVNEEGLSICRNATIQGSDCIDANNYNEGVGTWAPSASDWEGTTWKFTAVQLDLTEYKTNAKAAVDAYYLASAGLISNAKSQIEAATSTQGIDAALATAFAAYQAEVAPKYWIVRSGFAGYYNTQGVTKCLTYAYNGGTNMGWASEDELNPNCYMKLEINDQGKLYIKAAVNNQYIQGVAGAMGANVGGSSAITLVKYDDGTFNLNFGNGTAHTNGHSNGAGVSGNLVNWGGAGGTASSWVFVEKTEENYNEAVNWNTVTFHPVTRATELNGTYMLYNGCYNGNEDRTGFMKSNGGAVAHVGTHDRAITYSATRSMLWEVHPVDGVENGYTIYNVGTRNYIGVNGAKSAAPVTIYIQPWATSTHTKAGANFCDVYDEKSTDDATGFWTIGASASGNNGNDCWNGNPTTFALWSNSHPWAFYEVCPVEDGTTEAMISVAKDYAAHKVAQNSERVRKYGTFRDANLNSVNALTTSNTFEEYVAAINNIVSETVVVPEKGSFIRVQGAVSGNFIAGDASQANTRNALVADADQDKAESVLYYTGDGELIGFMTGRGFINTFNTATVGQTFEKHTFSASNYGNSGLTVLSNYSGSKVLYDGDTDINRNGSANSNNCAWYVYDVTALPVTVSAAGFATINAPVALALVDGVKAYTLSVEGEGYLHANEVSGIIRANTPVVLQAEAGTYNLNITEGGQAGANALQGTVAAIAKPEGALVLGVYEDEVGFYTLDNTVMAGFKAYYVAENGESNLRISFSELTGILSAAQQNGGSAIYDLQGRRVVSGNGVMIQNGKKVIK